MWGLAEGRIGTMGTINMDDVDRFIGILKDMNGWQGKE